MSQPMTVDARGLSCPEPVLLIQEALGASSGAGFVAMVSSATARDNVERALQSAKRAFTLTESDGEWRFEVQAG